jgi:glutamate racemase
MGRFGSAPGDIDTLVLGCTHYVFVENDLRALLGPDVQLVSTGEPVARQTHRLLASAGLLNTAKPDGAAPTVRLLTTGDLKGLQAAAQRWLGLPEEACEAVPASL